MAGHFHRFIEAQRRQGRLAVQPRMGFGSIDEMQAGLYAVAMLPCSAIGTITLDSYTRVGDYKSPLINLARGDKLNGFPIVTHSAQAVKEMLGPLYGADFPIQIRHGTAKPQRIFRRLVELGLDATEGGPISYCMPYSRVPLSEAVAAWSESCRILAGESDTAHIESFGGCLLGQLCPPSFLVATTLLEALFFVQHGIPSVSLSYAQGTLAAQDKGALRALRQLAAEYLAGVDWHVVVYTYMGVFPSTIEGARALIGDSARLAREAGCERLIVKTVAESRQIPTVQDNLDALMLAANAAAAATPQHDPQSGAYYEEVLQDARTLIDVVLNLHHDIGTCIVKAFRLGLMDIPYCLHADNPRRATTRIDEKGALCWARTGGLPLPRSDLHPQHDSDVTSSELLQMLYYLAARYDDDYAVQ